jgi:ribose transport system permease protein
MIDSRILGGNLSIVTVIFLLCVLLTRVLLAKLRLGRHIYSVGGNQEAARLSGVPVRRTLILAYALSGLLAAVAGICQAAQETQGDPETGMAYELDAIAMVVIGGTSLAGGRGSVTTTLVGVLTIGYLQKILSLNAAPEATRLILTGAIIICAVLFQRGR